MKFDNYHPIINLIYFTAVIGFTIAFRHPIFVVIAYISAFMYSVKLNGVRGFVFDLCLIPCITAYTGFYAYYNHFGVTVLTTNIIDNSMTLESVAYGAVIGVSAATVIMLFSCVFEIFTADKVVYIFGKISPKLSLFISIVLRSIPKIKKRTGDVNTSRKGIGRGAFQGNLLARLRNTIAVFSIMITWILESFVESAASMNSRGYSLRGRVAFSIYRFDNRDRGFVVFIFLCLTIIMMAVFFDQTYIYYNPAIVMNRITPVSYVFYAAYALLFLMPMFLQLIGERKFKRQRASAEGVVR